MRRIINGGYYAYDSYVNPPVVIVNGPVPIRPAQQSQNPIDVVDGMLIEH